MAEFARLRNGVEYPLQFSGYCVITADVSRRGPVSFVDSRSEDQDVLVHHARRGHLESYPLRIDSKVLTKIDVAVIAEGSDQLTRFCIYGVSAIPHEVKNPLSLRAL